MKIHPTAIIDPSARIHESVEIGPHCYIEAEVEIGEGTFLQSSVYAGKGTVIGRENQIFHNAVLGAMPQGRGFDRTTRASCIIGDRNIIREGCSIAGGISADTGTAVGDENYIMGNFHIGHDCCIGNQNTLTQGSMLAAHVTLGNRVVLSALSAVQQFCRIGDQSMIGGLTRVTKDVPPFCTVEGNPAIFTGFNSIGLKRAGFSSEIQNAIREAYELIFLSGLPMARAVTELKAIDDQRQELRSIVSFLESSERGIVEKR